MFLSHKQGLPLKLDSCHIDVKIIFRISQNITTSRSLVVRAVLTVDYSNEMPDAVFSRLLLGLKYEQLFHPVA